MFFQKYSKWLFVLYHLIKKGNLQRIKNLLIIVLIFSGTKYFTIGNTINEMFQRWFCFWRQEYVTLFIMNENDKLTKVFMEIFVVINIFSWKTQKQPVEQIGSLIRVKSVLSCNEKQSLKWLLLNDSLDFFPSKEEILKSVLLLNIFCLLEVLKHWAWFKFVFEINLKKIFLINYIWL